MEYTEEQLDGVNSSAKRLLIKSVAGSGKTTVIIARIKRLLEEGVSPDEILVMTFTNKMAAELKSKLPGLQWVGNFHTIGLNAINRLGDKRYTPVTEMEQESILKGLMKKNDYNVSIKRIKEIIGNQYKLERKDLKNVEHSLLIAYKLYMEERGIVSFDEIEIKWLELLQDGAFESFDHVIVDEFQDTSEREMDIIDLINTEHLCVVGDPCQCIYEWRNSTIDNIQFFDADEEVAIGESFRVSNKAVDFINSLMKNIEVGSEFRSDQSGGIPEIISIEEEGVAEKISEILSKVTKIYSPKDIMILCRTNREIDQLKETIVDYPVESVKNTGGWDSTLGMILRAFYNFCLNRSNQATEVLLNFLNIEDARTRTQWMNESALDGESLNTIVLGSETAGSTIWEELNIFAAEKMLPVEKGRRFYESYILPRVPERSRLEYKIVLDSCMYTIEILQNMHGVDEAGIVEGLIAINTQDLITDDDSVKMMTYHTAKGLEAEVVILPYLENGKYPRDPRSNRIQEEWRLFYVGVTRHKKKLYLIKTGECLFLEDYESEM